MQSMNIFGAIGFLAFFIPLLQMLLYISAIVLSFKAIQALNVYINKNS